MAIVYSSSLLLVTLLVTLTCLSLFFLFAGIVHWSKRELALSKIPGPKLLSFTRLWILRNVYRFGFSEKCVTLAKTYGKRY